MTDKGHCKIAYEEERDILEVSDYFDFSSSYPDATEHAEKQKVEGAEEDGEEVVEEEGAEGEEWEDVESGEEEESEEEDELPSSGITFGDSNMELVLPSGARIGHRSMRRYYAQNFRPSSASTNGNTKPVPHLANDPNSGAALVRRLLAEKNSALVPSKGGFGAFGSGMQVVKARNRGEAREAGRHTREFRDMNRREQFKTKVGFNANYQKHFRDPLLQ